MRKILLTFFATILFTTGIWAQLSEGPWTYMGCNHMCSGAYDNTSISYNNLNYTLWSGSISQITPNEKSGMGFYTIGTSNYNTKMAIYSLYAATHYVPPYAVMRWNWRFRLRSSLTNLAQQVGLYTHTDENTLRTTPLDFMYNNSTDAGSAYRIGLLQGSGYADFNHDFWFDNRYGSDWQERTCYMILTQILWSGDGGPYNYEQWATFQNLGNAYYYDFFKYITFNPDGGTGSMPQQTIQNGANLTPNAFTRPHYVFNGWHDDTYYYPDGCYVVANMDSKGPMTLYAMWTPAPQATLTAPTTRQLTYNGSAQQLVNAGSASGGTMLYSLDNYNWSPYVPTATDMGTYTVYYRVVADDAHTDNPGGAITAIIGKAPSSGTTLGPWTYDDARTGWTGYDGAGTSIAFNGLNNTQWSGNTYRFNDADGCGYAYLGTTTINSKYAIFSTYTHTENVPSYTRRVLTWNYQLASWSSYMWNTTSLYAADNLAYLKTLPVDFTETYTDGSGSFYHQNHLVQQSPGLTASDVRTAWFAFDNRGGSTAANKTVALMLTQVIGDGTGANNFIHNWGGFRSVSEAWTTLYYKYINFNPNGGSGSMAQQEIENSGNLTANAFTYAHKVFNGWSDGVNTYADGAMVTATADNKGPVTLYAQWIDAPMATFTAPTAASLTYTGSAQALINAGTAEGGEMQYKLDDGEWSTELPQATDAGNYTIYYRVVGDDNHIDNSGSSVDVTIAAATVLYDDASPTTVLTGIAATQEAFDITINRTIYADGDYNTICLPFDVTEADFADPSHPLYGYERLKAFRGAQVSGTGQDLSIDVFVKDATEIVAGTPYLITYPSNHGDIVDAVFNNVLITATEPGSVSANGVTFQGMFAPVHITSYEQNTTQDYLFLAANNQLAWPANDATSMRGFRAYFIIDRQVITPSMAPRNSRARIVEHSDTTTDMETVTGNPSPVTQKLLENGQLIIIKNGVRYNAQGQMVK